MLSFKMKFRPALHFSRVDKRHSFLWQKSVPQLFQIAQMFITSYLQLFPIKNDAETLIIIRNCSIMHDIGYNSFLFFLDTLLNYSQSRLGAINDRMFPNTVFEAALKTTYLFRILLSYGNFGHLESLGWFFISSQPSPYTFLARSILDSTVSCDVTERYSTKIRRERSLARSFPDFARTTGQKRTPRDQADLIPVRCHMGHSPVERA